MKEKPLNLQQKRVEKLKELGSRLRQLRQEQSLRLEEVATTTRIQTRLLRAIEQGKLDQLPEPVYIQGFIKRFADALGLDGEDFASDFPTEVGLSFMRPSWRDLPAAQLRPIHLYLLYILLVMGAVSGLSHVMNRSNVQVSEVESKGKATEQPVKQVQPSQVTLVQKLPVNSDVAKNPPQTPQSDQSVKVGVTLKEQSWIRVVADGKTEFEGVLNEGEQRTWVAKEKLIVRAGNAGGVFYAFNDQKEKQLGGAGQVQEVTFKANPRS